MIGPLVVDRRQLRLGPLLAEGGEGRVYELADTPDRVYKAYRTPQAQAGLAELVGWPATLGPAAARRVEASTAWPLAVVSDLGKGNPAMAAGLLLPRAPRRFSLRHRDGRAHLATLSYLTADPDRRSAAYGIDLPGVMSPERLGLVYALARLIEAFESASPAVSHGDLSARNVLWSLSRGPEVFVIDCDNGERFASAGPEAGEARALGPAGRRRAMTPNWDDPSVPSGQNPGPFADRYALALIFLRVCGGAHYPIQKRQKAGEPVEVEIGVPVAARRVRTLGPGAGVWELCSEALGALPAGRPPAAAWVAALEGVIGELGEARILDAVWASQGRAPLGGPAGVPGRLAGGVPGPASPAGSPAPAGGGGSLGAGDLAPTGVLASTAGAEAPPSPVSVRPVPFRPRLDRQPSRIAVPPAAAAAFAPGRRGGGWTVVRTPSGGLAATPGAGGGPPAGWAVGPGGQAGAGVNAPPPGPSIPAQIKGALGAVVSWILAEHRTTLRYLRTPDQRSRGVWRLPWCAALDFVAACLVLFLAAMIAAPFLGV